MSALFKSPKMPEIPEPPKPPTTDDARQAEEDILRMRRRRGRASTFLTGNATAPSRSAAAQLLGNASPGASGGSGGRMTTPGRPSRAAAL